MKTMVIMQRDLNGVPIRQESKTQFFNANDLLALHNKSGKQKKDVDDYLNNKSTKEFIGALVQDQIQNTQNSGELENLAYCSRRGKNGGTWMHPYLFIDFAFWLSPEFKLSCIKWIYDNLIKSRNEAGDTFKEVNQALFDSKPNSAHWIYANEAKMINKLIFGTPERDQRNLASESQLNLLKALQKADIYLIKKRLDYFDRIKELEKLKNAYLLMT